MTAETDPAAPDPPQTDRVVARTERLLIRDWRASEAGRMFDMYSRPDVVRFLGSAPTPMASLEQAQSSIARVRERNAAARAGCGWWAIEVAATGVVAGTIAVVPVAEDPAGNIEVAWHLHPDSQGHGYATEAARAVIDRAHAHGIERLIVLVAPANTASLAVAGRLGLPSLGVTEQFYDTPLELFLADGSRQR